MLHIFEAGGDPTEHVVLAAMFEARKRIFIDLLGWDVPVLHERYELDQFDTPQARYIVLTTPTGDHLASARLLPSTRPHILGSLYPGLCEEAVPTGAAIAEVTRFCVDRRLRATDRLVARNRLVSALVDDAFVTGTRLYTAVAEMAWLQQILSFGWVCRPLGLPQIIDGKATGALAIEISSETPDLLERAGIYSTASIAREHRHAA